MKNNSHLLVGIDVGSTTVKVAVLNPELEILFSSYERHHTKQAQCVLKLLEDLEEKFSQFSEKNGERRWCGFQ